METALLILMLTGRAHALQAGEAAPDFALPDQHGEIHRLADYRGEWLVLYFYPKDDTPGCTTEACSFRDDIVQIRDLGCKVVGVSTDSPESHAKFAEKYGLPFPLLADESGEVAGRYNALTRFGPLRLAKRRTYIINPDAAIARVYRKVRPAEHSDEVIADLKRLVTEHQANQ